MKMRLFLELFVTFFKIGLFTFGGGYAMISVIEDICVEQKRWISHDEMMDVTVIAESTPGPMAINCATFVGYRQAGFFGAVLATLGIVLPAFGILFFISMFFEDFLEIAWIANAFKGIKIAVGLLIFHAGINMYQKMKRKQSVSGNGQKMQMKGKMKGSRLQSRITMASAFAAMFLANVFGWKISSISLMMIAAAAGLVTERLQNSKDSGGESR